MPPKTVPPEAMSAEEKFNALANLKDKLEDNFISLGQLLSEIKRSKLYLYKGYENFKDFVEMEYQLSGTLAGKLMSTFDLFIEEMDIDETEVKEIGFDRLQMIKPFMKNADWNVRDEWIHKAEEMPFQELREYIKELKQKEKESNIDLKEVYIEQFWEKMTGWFNCSRKELNFKLALYFQDADLDNIKKIIKERQHLFELEKKKKKE